MVGSNTHLCFLQMMWYCWCSYQLPACTGVVHSLFEVAGMKIKTDGLTGVSSPVVQMLYWSAVVNRMKKMKAKLSVY